MATVYFGSVVNPTGHLHGLRVAIDHRTLFDTPVPGWRAET
jgi:hypothetical protein